MLRQLCRRNLGLKQWYHSSAIRQAPPPRYVRFSYPNPNSGNSNKGNFFQDRTWPIKVGIGIAGLGTIYYVSCLEQVPETGRWRFISVSPQSEAQVGQLTLNQTLNEYGPKILPPDHPIALHVKRVVSAILDASQLGVVKGYTQSQLQKHLDFVDDEWKNPDTLAKPPHSAIASPNREWEVVVVNDLKIVNAAATPGTVILFTGILPICRDEQGLAAVLSHEIGHVVARHTAERLSSRTVAVALGLFLSLFGIDFGVSSILNTMLLELPNSRLQEREADLIGLRLMSKACYDPKASPEMFERLGQIEAKASRKGIRAPEFFNTHPSSESRVKDLEARLGEGYDILAANPQCAGLQNKVQAFREKAGIKTVNVFEHMKDEDMWS